MQKITIKHPENSKEFDQYCSIRWEVLRKPLDMPKGSEKFPDEDDENHYHFIAELDGRIVGTGMLVRLNESEGQLKQMAVLQDDRGQDIGSVIFKAIKNKAKSLGLKTLVADARKLALDFYLKNDFKVIDDTEYNIIGIPHLKIKLDL